MTPIPSASLIVLCPRTSKNGPNGHLELVHDTLMVQRSARDGSSFRSAVVFPGGALDVVDEEIVRNFCTTTGRQMTEQEMLLLALKICSLRETFEETGLLLVPSQKTTLSNGLGWSRAVGPTETGITSEEWQDVRERVHHDAANFLPFYRRVTEQLGTQLNQSSLTRSGFPRLPCMMHYSNWITPRSVVRPAKRFDAHFLITVLDTPNIFADSAMMGIKADGTETLSLKLGTPGNIVSEGILDRLVLFPPQFYILADLHAALTTAAPTSSPLENIQPLIFSPHTEPRVTPVEEEARGLDGRNFAWDRKDVAHASKDPLEKTNWVSDSEPPLLAEDVATAIEPKGLIKLGRKISTSVPDDDGPYVFPLVLTGDYQASSSRDLILKSTGDVNGKRMNRMYVFTRPKELGGGLVVKGCVRKCLNGLRDFQIGVMLHDENAKRITASM
ncbi:hypothetical protein HDU85_001283 [Gaertneriomyces sp. JEL0708]|nr:hypothetical protein HDU85_001283 [Gaertneriomyces sp. JEL0708]